MTALWRIRQHSCIDGSGKVVDVRTEKGIGHPDVVAWRVRWDAPGYPGRSRTFTKSSYPTVSAAHADRLVDDLRERTESHDESRIHVRRQVTNRKFDFRVKSVSSLWSYG